MDAHELRTTYTWPAAIAAGLTRADIRDDGVRVTRGAYAPRAVPLTLRNACRAAAQVLPAGTVFSHLTAAALLGAPVPHDWPLRVVVRGGLSITSGPQTLLDLSTVLATDELVAVGDALYRSGHLDHDSIDERLRRADGARGIVVARHVAPLLTPLAASQPESLFRYWLTASDLPDPRPQVPVLDRWGREVAHVDLGYDEWKVGLEYEGRQHAESRQFGRDLERYSLMAAGGWLLLRFGGPHLHRRPAVIERVAGALRSRGARW